MLSTVIAFFIITGSTITFVSGYKMFAMHRKIRTQKNNVIQDIERMIIRHIEQQEGGVEAFAANNPLEYPEINDVYANISTQNNKPLSLEEKKFGVNILRNINVRIEGYKQFDCNEVGGLITAAIAGLALSLPSALINIGLISTTIPSIVVGVIAVLPAAMITFATFYIVKYLRSKVATRLISQRVAQKLVEYSATNTEDIKHLIEKFEKSEKKYSNVIHKRYINILKKNVTEKAQNRHQEPEDGPKKQKTAVIKSKDTKNALMVRSNQLNTDSSKKRKNNKVAPQTTQEMLNRSHASSKNKIDFKRCQEIIDKLAQQKFAQQMTDKVVEKNLAQLTLKKDSAHPLETENITRRMGLYDRLAAYKKSKPQSHITHNWKQKSLQQDKTLNL